MAGVPVCDDEAAAGRGAISGRHYWLPGAFPDEEYAHGDVQRCAWSWNR